MYCAKIPQEIIFGDEKPANAGFSRSSTATCQEPSALLRVIDKTSSRPVYAPKIIFLWDFFPKNLNVVKKKDSAQC
jgi:hypothetical protein